MTRSTIINTAKYGDDNKHEAFVDNYLFFPIADVLIDPLRNIGLTPNMVTILSTFFTLLTIYFLHNDNKPLAIASYLLGYTLDCVDGKMARKYNMGTKTGMILDLSSDVISNIILSIYIVYKYKIRDENLFLAVLTFTMTFLLAISYALNEAILSYKETGSDDFYNRRYNELKDSNNIFNWVFLKTTFISHKIYKHYFPVYNQDIINKWLPLLKEMGPGTINIMVAILIYHL